MAHHVSWESKKDVNICFFVVDFEELDKPGLRPQLGHLLILCPWVKYMNSELGVFTCEIETVPYFKVLVCGFVEIAYGMVIVNCLHIVMFS